MNNGHTQSCSIIQKKIQLNYRVGYSFILFNLLVNIRLTIMLEPTYDHADASTKFRLNFLQEVKSGIICPFILNQDSIYAFDLEQIFEIYHVSLYSYAEISLRWYNVFVILSSWKVHFCIKHFTDTISSRWINAYFSEATVPLRLICLSEFYN